MSNVFTKSFALALLIGGLTATGAYAQNNDQQDKAFDQAMINILDDELVDADQDLAELDEYFEQEEIDQALFGEDFDPNADLEQLAEDLEEQDLADDTFGDDEGEADEL